MAAGTARKERLNRIIQKLEMKKAVSVSELSKELATSVVTIRKDLQRLEQEGKLKRVSGGAVLANSQEEGTDLGYSKEKPNRVLKLAVAEKAAELIQDGDSLIMTAGMTTHMTVRYADDRAGLKIVTDSLITAEDLCRHAEWQVIILGGEICERDFFVHGRDAVRQVSRYMADKAIVTMDGVDVDAGLTTLRVEGVNTLKSILARARTKILVADITKIGIESCCHVGNITDVDILVTNRTEDAEKLKILKAIAERGVEVICTDEVE